MLDILLRHSALISAQIGIFFWKLCRDILANLPSILISNICSALNTFSEIYFFRLKLSSDVATVIDILLFLFWITATSFAFRSVKYGKTFSSHKCYLRNIEIFSCKQCCWLTWLVIWHFFIIGELQSGLHFFYHYFKWTQLEANL